MVSHFADLLRSSTKPIHYFSGQLLQTPSTTMLALTMANSAWKSALDNAELNINDYLNEMIHLADSFNSIDSTLSQSLDSSC